MRSGFVLAKEMNTGDVTRAFGNLCEGERAGCGNACGSLGGERQARLRKMGYINQLGR